MKKMVSFIIFILFLGLVVAGTATAAYSDTNLTNLKKANLDMKTGLITNNKSSTGSTVPLAANITTKTSTQVTTNTLKSTSQSKGGVYQERYWWDQKQHGIHSCGPTSGAMALSALGIIVDHEHMTRHYHTTLTNTKPSAIIQGSIEHAAEQRIKIQGWLENFSGRWKYLGQLIANPKIAVILHGNTSGWRKYYKSNTGHYVFPVKVDLNQRKIWIADPDRSGTLEYTFDEFKPGLDAINQPSMIILKRFSGGSIPSPSYYKYINAPRVKLTTPTNKKTGYSLNANLTIQFTEDIKASANYKYITVTNLSTKKNLKIITTPNGSKFNIKTEKRTANTWYQVTIPNRAVEDESGNNLLANYVFRFKTGL